MKNTLPTLLLLFIASLLSSTNAYSTDFGEPTLGKMKAPSCVFCHSPSGTEPTNTYPNLKGQDPLYLFNAMKSYQNGERTGALSEMMKAQLQHLNDQDLRDIAAFYNSATK